MANDVSSLEWVLDTPGSSTIWPDAWWCNEIRWEGYNGNPDTVVLTDLNGKTIFTAVGITPPEAIATQFGSHQRYFGLKMPTLASGKVYIAIR